MLFSDSGEIDRDEMRECIEICTKESNLGKTYFQTDFSYLFIKRIQGNYTEDLLRLSSRPF